MSPVTPVPEIAGSALVTVEPAAGLVIVGAGGVTATVKVSVAAVELGPVEAACVAVTVWLALLSAMVGVKLQSLLATEAVPATVPSMDTVTVSPVTPVPEIAGSALVTVEPAAGLVIVGAGGVVLLLSMVSVMVDVVKKSSWSAAVTPGASNKLRLKVWFGCIVLFGSTFSVMVADVWLAAKLIAPVGRLPPAKSAPNAGADPVPVTL